MTDNRKEQERAELHRVIWNIANDLRGSVDGWDCKQYVLGMLFYRYISENLCRHWSLGLQSFRQYVCGAGRYVGSC
jgi:type I restriction enzyme M protein